ncbi:4-hydroxy-tetrahydrodipicolinate synthase [Stomatohabitans albus]|uniref:4-hydroxy-tetrahydrodipicolinate synthase n=1 Tax=Stomatohabitans albus TaxID=3110766 RepID=UPI00300C7B4E
MAAFPSLMTAMITPFTAEGAVDIEAAARIASFLVDQGSEGIVVTGTTGESATMSLNETELMWRCVTDTVGDRATVIAGVGVNDTAESVRRTVIAEQAGVHGVMAVAPYYIKPSQVGLVRHFTTIAASTELPVLLYDIPGRTAVEIAKESLLDLADIPNIVGVKDAVGNIAKATWLIKRAPEGFDVWSGDDSALLPWLSLGAVGIVSVASHIVAPQLRELITVFPTNPARATALHMQLSDVFSILFKEPNPAPVKAALHELGYCLDVLRSPMLPVSDETRADIIAAMRALDLLK